MMKYWYVIIIVVNALALSAQNVIPNADFENWQQGGGLFSSYEDPSQWGTLNSVSDILGVNSVTKTTQSQFVKNGNAALRLETYYLNLLSRHVQGICVTGSINTQNEQVEGGVPYNLRPDAFTGWYQYYPNGIDTASVVALFTKWNFITQQRDTIGLAAKWITNQSSSYTQFEIPVDYSSDLIPDSLLIILVCSSQTNPSTGTVMYIDGLQFDFSTSIASNVQLPNIRVFPNPTANLISVENEKEFAFMQVYSSLGVLVKRIRLQSGLNQVEVADLPAGTYLAMFEDNKGEVLAQTKWIVNR